MNKLCINTQVLSSWCYSMPFMLHRASNYLISWRLSRYCFEISSFGCGGGVSSVFYLSLPRQSDSFLKILSRVEGYFFRIGLHSDPFLSSRSESS